MRGIPVLRDISRGKRVNQFKMAASSPIESLLTDLRQFVLFLFSNNNVYYGILIGLVFGILSGWFLRGKLKKRCETTQTDGKVGNLNLPEN